MGRAAVAWAELVERLDGGRIPPIAVRDRHDGALQGVSTFEEGDGVAQENSEDVDGPPTSDRRRSWVIRGAVGAAAVGAAVGAAVVLVLILGRPGVSLSSDGQSLAQLRLRGLAELVGVQATSAGRTVELVRGSSGLVPASQLAQGQTVRITATIAPPSWLRWLLGPSVSTTTTVHTIRTVPTSAVAVASPGGLLRVRFRNPVRVVEYRFSNGPVKFARIASASRRIDLIVPRGPTEGSLQVGGAAQPWERVGTMSRITWFVAPAGSGVTVVAQPVPGTTAASIHAPITLTFDEPVAMVLGDARPTVSPAVAGTWSEPAPDTLVFNPSNVGVGYGPSADVTVRFARPVTILGTTNRSVFHFKVRPGSLLRLEQLLAELHYLPLNFVPAPGVVEPTTFAGEASTIDDPVAGSFTWRWASTPALLRAEWSLGSASALLKGALMAFDATRANYDGYLADGETVAQLADATTWEALLEDVVTHHVDPYPYSYVYVTENAPENLTIWENGAVVLRSPANTGISEAPTAAGTYPIYVRYAENYMSGTNPDGSTYDDLVQWINYFNGGDAVHGFVRSSYGFPQSLGCVELPVPTAAKAFPRLAVGDLVTVAA